MIAFRDFVPELIDRGGFFSKARYETMQDALAEANEWVNKNKVEVINLETVVLPNIHAAGEEGSQDVELPTANTSVSLWFQFIRVWYRPGE